MLKINGLELTKNRLYNLIMAEVDHIEKTAQSADDMLFKLSAIAGIINGKIKNN